MALQSQIIAHLDQFTRERVNLPHAAERDATARHQNTPTPNGNHRHSLAQLLPTGKGLVAAVAAEVTRRISWRACGTVRLSRPAGSAATILQFGFWDF